MQPPWKKLPPLFQKPLSQSWGPIKPPPLENLVRVSTSPPSRKGGGGRGCTLWGMVRNTIWCNSKTAGVLIIKFSNHSQIFLLQSFWNSPTLESLHQTNMSLSIFKRTIFNLYNEVHTYQQGKILILLEMDKLIFIYLSNKIDSL